MLAMLAMLAVAAGGVAVAGNGAKAELDAPRSLLSAQRVGRAYCVEVSGAHGR
jgi:hypothetical protein